MRELEIVRADPAGNITLFVLTPVEKKDCAAVGAALLKQTGLGGEQVGFLFPDGHMEMAAGEFCGNATRACGYLLCSRSGAKGKCSMTLSVSGCDHPVRVDVDMDAGTAWAEMPLPELVEKRTVNGVEGTLVHLGGIAHFVTEDVTPSMEFFAAAESLFAPYPELEAYGVCFLQGDRMTPLVKVPKAGTLIFEGSCGSGTVAAAAARSAGQEGEFSLTLQQPAGTVSALVRRKQGRIVSAAIGGTVRLEPAMTVWIE